MFANSIYRSMPIKVQEGFISLRAGLRNMIRENRILTNEFLKGIETNEYLDEKGLANLTLKKLKTVLKSAQTTIPYYRDEFKRIGFHYEDLTRLDIMNDLPILEKNTIIKNLDRFIPLYPKRLLGYAAQTSGTSGSPLTIYQDVMAVAKERSFHLRVQKWAGYKAGIKNIWLRGDMIVPVEQKDPPFWRYNRSDNQLMMSTYHISGDNLFHYIKKIRDFRPDMIFAYPSAIFTLAAYMMKNDMAPIKTRAIITSSETLFPEQKDVIEAMFAGKVYDIYGSFERVAMIATCEKGRYHICEDYGYTELIQQETGDYEVVSTGYNNLFMPLIRYRSRDIVRTENVSTCPCGRHFRTIDRIIGRMDDYIVMPDGRVFQGLGFLFKGDLPILEGQIYQNKDYSIELRVVPDRTFSKEHERIMIDNAKNRIGSGISIKIVCCDAIHRTTAGKLKTIVSEIRPDFMM